MCNITFTKSRTFAAQGRLSVDKQLLFAQLSPLEGV